MEFLLTCDVKEFLRSGNRIAHFETFTWWLKFLPFYQYILCLIWGQNFQITKQTSISEFHSKTKSWKRDKTPISEWYLFLENFFDRRNNVELKFWAHLYLSIPGTHFKFYSSGSLAIPKLFRNKQKNVSKQTQIFLHKNRWNGCTIFYFLYEKFGKRIVKGRK